MIPGRITADFVGESGQRIFLLAHHPQQFSGRCVLVCPPFAEEMNKSRKMLTELAKRLNDHGIGLVIPDLYGTGDSEGDFRDATWQRWLADMHDVEQWMHGKGWQMTSLLGIRLGCLLAAQYAAGRQQPIDSTVFWQPIIDGMRALDQFLRVRVAASLMNGAKQTTAELKARFAAGECVEVAGYGIAPRLATELESLKLSELVGQRSGNLHWMEILRAAEAPVPIPTAKCISELQSRMKVTLHTVVGEPFWAASEIVVNPDVLAATAELVVGGVAHG